MLNVVLVDDKKRLTREEVQRIREADRENQRVFKEFKDEADSLKTRVTELEELLCPVMSHDWVYVTDSVDNPSVDYDYLMCSRCKKRIMRVNTEPRN